MGRCAREEAFEDVTSGLAEWNGEREFETDYHY